MKNKHLILKHALSNAILFNGKANPNAVIGKIINEMPELKSKIGELQPQVREIIKEINTLTLEEQRNRLKRLGLELIIKKKKEKEPLHELRNAVKGKFVTRIAPEPSKYIHIGHALSFLINYLYCKKYDGKCVLRFEDTNPEKSSKIFYDSIKDDLKWLKIDYNKEVIVSNDMEKLYKYANLLIEMGMAYVCFCSRVKMNKFRREGKECKCRVFNKGRNISEWENILKGNYGEGDVTMRLKGDMSSDNYAMRDPVIFRLCLSEHFLQGKRYSAWPMYDFANAVEDELCKVTHILRSSEFGEMRIELQNYIKRLLNFKTQTIIQYGRFNVIGAITQGREIRRLIEEKKVLGWDDPSLVTVRALKRRGIVRETFYQLAKEVGLSKSETNIDWKLISSINRKILDSKCNRFFFIKDPIKIEIKNAPAQKVRLKLHPDFPERGRRLIETEDKFYVTRDDYKAFKDNRLYRLMDNLNFIKRGNKLIFDSLEYQKYKTKGERIIHWLPVKQDLVNVEVLVPDGKIVKGVAEPIVKKLSENDVIQFVRFGFCRLDEKKNNKLIFWYTHD